MEPPFCTNNEHRWPRSGGWNSHRSVGSVEVEQCNNCLAVRVTQDWINMQGEIIGHVVTVVEKE